MSESLKFGILVTSATEGQVERKLELERVLITTSSGSNLRGKSEQERRIKRLCSRCLDRANITKLHRGAVKGTLSYVGSSDRGIVLILRERSASSLVRRPVSTNFVEVWHVTRGYTRSIPSVHSHYSTTLIDSLLPEGHNLHANSIDLHLIEQLSNSVILRHTSQNIDGAYAICSSIRTSGQVQRTTKAVLQAEPSDISLA